MQLDIEGFLGFLATEKSFSKNTIAAYHNDLAQFSEFAERQVGDTVDRETVLSFVLDLKDKRYAATTVARKIAAIRSYFHYLLAKGELREDPTEDLDSPKIGRALPHAISVSEVDRLLAATEEASGPESLRDRAMLELLYATGMRVTELVSLDVDDINLQPGNVRCSGRGGRERIIPVSYDRMAAVERYAQEARPQLLRRPDQGALFLNHRGERLTRQGFWLIIKGYAKRAQIESSITPHVLRHSFAAHLISSGAELRAVQEIMGHASISSTQVYTQINPERLRREWERAHPLAR
ncbi:MAG: site-specific tyrosine recombinase XerD [Chloroflexi bacterium]|nr:site-specific tyrosine recombinase XerD [Chloroflexota bacterium]MCL5110178.1 site-specific tyrosine recombinase XerD [Chloroflexota bacterium]